MFKNWFLVYPRVKLSDKLSLGSYNECYSQILVLVSSFPISRIFKNYRSKCVNSYFLADIV